jgi:hypothetical protein
MHLGLVDGPFVPPNLISTQESPVLLLKFQMALTLRILMASGSKKGTQTYFSFFSYFPANEPLQVIQKGREARLQGILHVYQKLHLSGSPAKEPSLKVPFHPRGTWYVWGRSSYSGDFDR